MLAVLKPVQRISLSDGIVEQITGLIARGVLKPGDRIPSEKQLCQQFGVGRTSVREALRSLTVMGILESHAGDGTFVSASRDRYLERAFQWGLLLDRKMVEDLVETRLMLESQTAFLAASKATVADLKRIAEAVQGMEKHVADPERYLEFDLQFHQGIARATQNSILHSLLSTTRGYLQAWIRETLAGSSRRPRLSIKEHKRILEALTHRDSARARDAMSEHILSSSRDLKRHLSPKAAAGYGTPAR
ncbi:MAG: FadR family transcriptional regulator [Acidobacteria bacterium]|nr:FadR family transcriptional regulator [Acidobacteriota bacterium]